MSTLVLVVAGTVVIGGCGEEREVCPEIPETTEARPWISSSAQLEIRANTSPENEQIRYSISGYFYDSFPAFHEVTATAGDCVLMQVPATTCDWQCDNIDDICTPTGECTPYPSRVSAGAIDVGGVLLHPDDALFYGAGADEPFFEECAAVTARAEGAEFPGFELTTYQVTPFLADDLTEEHALDGTEPLVLTWSDPDPRARVHFRMATDYAHGLWPPVVIACDAPDTGSLVVPAELIVPYVDGDNWGYSGVLGHGVVTRYFRSSTVTAAGEVGFESTTSRQILAYPFWQDPL